MKISKKNLQFLIESVLNESPMEKKKKWSEKEGIIDREDADYLSRIWAMLHIFRKLSRVANEYSSSNEEIQSMVVEVTRVINTLPYRGIEDIRTFLETTGYDAKGHDYEEEKHLSWNRYKKEDLVKIYKQTVEEVRKSAIHLARKFISISSDDEFGLGALETDCMTINWLLLTLSARKVLKEIEIGYKTTDRREIGLFKALGSPLDRTEYGRFSLSGLGDVPPIHSAFVKKHFKSLQDGLDVYFREFPTELKREFWKPFMEAIDEDCLQEFEMSFRKIFSTK